MFVVKKHSKMEVSAYISYALFSFFILFLAYWKGVKNYKVVLKLLAGAALIGLGVFSLVLSYVEGLSNTIDIYTYNSASWQMLLLIIFCMLGATSIIFALMEAYHNLQYTAGGS